MEFSRQQTWSGFPFPSPGDLPNPGIKPGSLALQADTLLSELPGKPLPEKMAYGTQPGSPPPNLHLYDSKEWFSLLFFKVFTCAQPLQSCPTLCDPMDCSSPGSPVHGTLQAKTLEWVSISSSRRLLYPGIEPRSLCLVNRQAGSLPPVPPDHKDVDNERGDKRSVKMLRQDEWQPRMQTGKSRLQQSAMNWVAYTTEIYLHAVLEARSPRSGCGQGSFFLRAVKDNLLPVS